MNKEIKAKLVGKLVNAQVAKVSNSVKKLEDFKDGLKLKQLEQQSQKQTLRLLTVKNSLVSKLVLAFSKKLESAFSKLAKRS